MKIKQLLMILLFLSACDSFQNPSLDQANNQNLNYNDELDSLRFLIESKIITIKKVESELDILQKQVNKISIVDKNDLDEIEQVLLDQQSDIQSFRNVLSITLDEFKELKSNINKIDSEIDAEISSLKKKQTIKKATNQIESRLLSVPFEPNLDKVNLGLFIKNSKSIFEVEILSVENLKYISKDSLIDFQLTITSQLNLNNVPQNGLVSFYQHSQPEQGIVNSTSAKLLINASNPFIFLNGNKEYQIYGNLILKLSGNFE